MQSKPAATWEKRGKAWSEYPIGTKAKSHTGAQWIQTERGWQAVGGDTFPGPGADAYLVFIPTPEIQEYRERIKTDPDPRLTERTRQSRLRTFEFLLDQVSAEEAFKAACQLLHIR